MSDRNSGKKWSEWDLSDLRYGLAGGYSLAVIAEVLRRDVEEVEAKAREVGWRGGQSLH
jgi:hypothetical protein